MQTILNVYYKNNAKKLHHMVDKLLQQFGGVDNKDLDDFYSLANEVFWDVLNRYDRNQPFETFLYSCLDRKIKTEMTRRNRKKRLSERNSISIETSVNGEDSLTIGDTIASREDVERNILDECRDEKILKYLKRLSNKQQEILNLIVIGYRKQEIQEILHMNSQEFINCMEAIHSSRNVSILIKKQRK